MCRIIRIPMAITLKIRNLSSLRTRSQFCILTATTYFVKPIILTRFFLFKAQFTGQSMEPLKKEVEQQLRNKEMRKEHLLTKGRALDNVYLF